MVSISNCFRGQISPVKYISNMAAAASSTPLHARSQPRDGIGRDSAELDGVIERTDSSASSSSSWDMLPQV